MTIISAAYVVRSPLDGGKGIAYTVYVGCATILGRTEVDTWYFHRIYDTRNQAFAEAQASLGQTLQSTYRVEALEAGEERISRIFRLSLAYG